jgi:predicted RNA-binding Zn ribbon-like protein
MAVRTVVNLSSYADLAVRLANCAIQAEGAPDPLSGTAACTQAFSDCISGPVYRRDVAVLQYLRDEFMAIFTAAASGNDAGAVHRLNGLLVQFPIQPELVSHDDQRYHVHLAEQGTVSDRLAAGAIIGLALTVSLYGVSRLGVCSIAACPRVFVDSSPNRSRLYCVEHGSRANVRTLRAHAVTESDVVAGQATPADRGPAASGRSGAGTAPAHPVRGPSLTDSNPPPTRVSNRR